jgi:hypothetical protein
MITNKRLFYSGTAMLAAFVAILIVMFMPVFNGQNGLNYLDALYNSISKGSAYYIPKMQQAVKPFAGRRIEATLTMPSPQEAQQTAVLLKKSGALVDLQGADLKVSGDLGALLANCLSDADALYFNKGEAVSAKYGYDSRTALYNWWSALKELDWVLNKQKLFKEASVIDQVKSKAVETAYNYYGIQALKITDKMAIVIFSLVFYVVYTLWYGFGIMYLFEGLGTQLEH